MRKNTVLSFAISSRAIAISVMMSGFFVMSGFSVQTVFAQSASATGKNIPTTNTLAVDSSVNSNDEIDPVGKVAKEELPFLGRGIKSGVASVKVVDRFAVFGFKKNPNGTAMSRTFDDVDTIIIHSTANPSLSVQTFEGALTLWRKYGVASHYAIDTKGVTYRLVPEKNIGFHAGDSILPNGGKNINTRSIGIDLVYGLKQSPTPAQYEALKSLLVDITDRYSITYIIGHSQIASNKKNDPWNFEWKKIMAWFNPAIDVFPSTITPVKSFQSDVAAIDELQAQFMERYSYRSDCPVSPNELRAVTVSYYNFSGVPKTGIVIVNKAITKETVSLFDALFKKKFPIQGIQPIDAFQGLADFSVLANNTSAFHCQYFTPTTQPQGVKFPERAYGVAIAINPLQNMPIAKAVAISGVKKDTNSISTSGTKNTDSSDNAAGSTTELQMPPSTKGSLPPDTIKEMEKFGWLWSKGWFYRPRK